MIDDKVKEVLKESCGYIGESKVLVEDNDYTLFIYLDTSYKPLVLYKNNTTEDEFLKHIEKEMNRMMLQKTAYFETLQHLSPLVKNSEGELELEWNYYDKR